MLKKSSWIDLLDGKIIPYIDAPDYETRYPVLSPLYISKSEKEKIQYIAREVCAVMAKLAEDVRSKGNVMPIDIINMTPKLTPFILDDDSKYVTNIARLDFVKDKNGIYKVVEINADTPCAMPEAFYGNAVAQKYFAGSEDDGFNAELIEPFTELLKTTLKGKINFSGVNITLAANDAYAEDWANMMYLKNALEDYIKAHFDEYEFVNVRAARLIDLVVKDDGVYHNDGSGEYKIDVLYRLHPLELLMDDESDEGYPVGLKLMDLANMHKVILVNPVKAILMQNKAMMAIAHYLAGSTGYFDDAAKQIVRTNIAETSMDAKDFAGRKFLKKPIFGREGCNISIIEPDGTFSYEAEEADDCADIYQEFIDSDLVIQEKYGTTLERIIEKYGDDGFIKIENDVNCTINAEHAVIATGGSAVYGETAMEHFKDIGTVIYLEVDEIELEERVGSLKERGVVSNGKTTIDEIFEDRKNLYRKYADITLNLNGKSIRESVDDIYDNLINKDSNY